MNYPLLSEYIEAIKDSEENFDELKHLRPVLDEYGEPIISSGNFAVVFKMKDIQTRKLYAVKCFLKEQEGRSVAYKQISETLKDVNCEFLIPIKYIDKELFVDSKVSEDSEFPVLLMDWVDGYSMESYIDCYKKDVFRMHRLFGTFCQMAMWLLKQNFAHGDLKPDNIIIREDGSLVLVDYDGMFVSSMKGQRAREIGSPDFRHPSRDVRFFNEKIDVFSLSSIALSLSYIAAIADKGTIEESSSCFLRESDILDPANSKLLLYFTSNSINTVCGKMLSIFYLTLADINISKKDIVFLFSSIINNKTVRSPFEERNSFKLDGIEYSFDGRKLLRSYNEDLYLNIKEGVEILCDRCLNNREYKIIQLPSSMKAIGIDAFNDSIHLFISNSPYFYVGECGLFSNDKRELIKCHSIYKRSILRLYPETELVRLEAYHNNSCYIYVVKEKQYFKLYWDNKKDYYDFLDIDGELIEDDFGAIYGKDYKNLLYFPLSSRVREYSIHEGCEVIEENSFVSDEDVCAGGHGDVDISIAGNNIETIHFPNTLNKIEDGALLGCIDLKNIFIDINKESDFTALLESYHETNYGSRRYHLDRDRFIYETIITEEDKKNCYLDEYGFKYSKDGLKLIEGNDVETPYSIKEGVKIICDSALYLIDCPNWVLPKSLVSIGEYSFADSGTIDFIVPENVKSIGNGAFLGEGFENVKILGKIRYMGRHVFSPDDNGSRLKHVELSEGVETLGDLAFSGCYNLKSITLPSTLMSMGDNPFSNSGVELIHNESRYFTVKNGCLFDRWNTHLISYFGKSPRLTFDTLYTIDNYAFAGNNNLREITIKDRLVIIGNNAFNGCKSLSIIEIPSTVQSIGASAFYGCSSLEGMEISPEVLEIGDHTFYGCYSLQNVILPSCLLEIGDSAFDNCASLTFLDLPSHIQALSSNPFKKNLNGNGVSMIRCVSNNNIHVKNGGLYNTHTKTLVSVFSEDESYIVEEGTIAISDYAFHYCKRIKSVYFPKDIIKIGDSVFWGCEQLEYVVLGENIKEISHPYSLFEFCKSLKRIYVKSNDVIYNLLYESNREYRNKLKKVSETTVIPDYEFYRLPLVNDGAASYDYNNRIVSYGDTYRSEYRIKDGTKVICDNCFFDEYNEIDCNYLSDLFIPASVKFIGNNPFCGSISNIECESPHFVVDGEFFLSANRKKLIFYFGDEKHVIIPEGIEEIGSGAFCSRNLATVHIPSTVLRIGDNPFISIYNYDDINSDIPQLVSQTTLFLIENNTLIDTDDKRIISYWGKENKYKVNEHVKSIGACAFFGAIIEEVELPKSIDYIDETAFDWCFNLKRIVVPKGLKYDISKLLSSYLHNLIVEE